MADPMEQFRQAAATHPAFAKAIGTNGTIGTGIHSGIQTDDTNVSVTGSLNTASVAEKHAGANSADSAVSPRFTADRSHHAASPALVSRRSTRAVRKEPSADWTADDWLDFYNERAGIAEYDGCLSRPDAEARALECGIVQWLNQNPERSDPGRCAHCGVAEKDGADILPYGTADHGHTWVHGACWPAWYQDRRDRAWQALADMGVPPDAG